MTRSSSHARLTRRLAIFHFLALSILLLPSHPSPLAADQAAQAGWRFNIEEGKQTRSTVAISNRCSAPHRFRIKSKIKYLRFEQPTDAILVGAASTEQIGMVFDATKLKSKVYRDKVVVECLDCKKERGCSQDRDELAVEMAVMGPIIYSWCVELNFRNEPRNSSCKVISATPNYSSGPCKKPFLTMPNDGKPIPKEMPLKTCLDNIQPREHPPNRTNVKKT